MNTISKEKAYITDCLAYKLLPGREFPIPAEGMDWEKLYALIASQRLSGLFFALGQEVDVWPLSFKQHLRSDCYQYSLYGHQCSQRIKTLLEAMSSSGVRVIVLKGWAHIQTIYDRDYSQRLCEDIDILIHPHDVDVVEGILHRLEYMIDREGWPGYNRRYFNGARYFPSGTDFASAFSIGLHWGLIHMPSYDPKRIDVDNLFANALHLDVMGVSVLQLAPEDEVVYLCGHVGLHHRFDGAIFRYYELAWLITRVDTHLDWEKVIEKSIAWRHVLPVRYTLLMTNQLWKGVVGQETVDMLLKTRPAWGEHFVDFWLKKTRGSPAFDHLLMWITFPRILERPLIMLQDIFPSPGYMVARYGSAPFGLWPLLYVRRFFRALRLL